MEKHLIIVFTAPVEGRESEYNAFYNQTHMPEVVALKGVVAGQRFVADSASSSAPPNPYLTVYELEGDLDTIRAGLAEGLAQLTPIPDSFDQERDTFWWFTAISDRIERDDTD